MSGFLLYTAVDDSMRQFKNKLFRKELQTQGAPPCPGLCF